MFAVSVEVRADTLGRDADRGGLHERVVDRRV